MKMILKWILKYTIQEYVLDSAGIRSDLIASSYKHVMKYSFKKKERERERREIWKVNFSFSRMAVFLVAIVYWL